LKQWGEGISPRFLYENRIPSDVELESIDKSIEIDQQRDRKDR
jgi:hypothetical protein